MQSTASTLIQWQPPWRTQNVSNRLGISPKPRSCFFFLFFFRFLPFPKIGNFDRRAPHLWGPYVAVQTVMAYFPQFGARYRDNLFFGNGRIVEKNRTKNVLSRHSINCQNMRDGTQIKIKSIGTSPVLIFFSTSVWHSRRWSREHEIDVFVSHAEWTLRRMFEGKKKKVQTVLTYIRSYSLGGIKTSWMQENVDNTSWKRYQFVLIPHIPSSPSSCARRHSIQSRHYPPSPLFGQFVNI